MHFHKWKEKRVIFESFDTAELRPSSVRACECGLIRRYILDQGGGYWDDGRYLQDGYSLVDGDDAGRWLRIARERVHKRMTEAKYCPVCGSPLDRYARTIAADPQTGQPLKLEITIFCNARHVHYIYEEAA